MRILPTLPGIESAAGWSHPYPTSLFSPFFYKDGGDGGDDDGGDDNGDQDDGADDKSDKDKGDGDGTDWKSEAEKWKAQSRKHEARAKENASAAKERDKLKREGMSDVEKRVDEAVAAARAEERVKSGVKVARQAFLAAAQGRLKNAKDIADEFNLKKYVNEDGEVDEDAIAELVNRIAPKSDTDEDEDDDREDERDTRRRRRGLGQGARNGTGRSKSKRSGPADGDQLYEELIGPLSNRT